MGELTNAAGTVLIIDDEVDIREMIEMTLTLDGYRVLTAEGGERAMEIARDQKLDLVITDIKMPGMNGLEIVHRLRELTPDVAIIVVTGYLTPDSVAECEKLGASELIRKPFLIEELESAIARTLHSASD